MSETMFHIRYQVTSGCNERCPMCSEEGALIPKSRGGIVDDLTDITTDQARSLFTTATQVLGGDKLSVALTGGEPTLKRAKVLDLSSHLATLQLADYWLNTNGLTLKKDFIKEMVDTGLKKFKISLHSVVPQKFGFFTGTVGDPQKRVDQVLTAVNTCLDLGAKVDLNMVLAKGVNDKISDLEPYVPLVNKGALLKVLPLEPEGYATSDHPFYRRYNRPVEQYLKEIHAKRLGAFDFTRGGIYQVQLASGQNLTFAALYACSPGDVDGHPYAKTSYLVTSDGRIKQGMWGDNYSQIENWDDPTALKDELSRFMNYV